MSALRAAGRTALMLVLLAVPARMARADHFPDAKVASGEPEHSLAGVDVYRDTINVVLTKLGKPQKKQDKTAKDSPNGSGERSYEWTREGVRLRVSTEFYTSKQNGKIIESIYAVDVWGARSKTDFSSTSKGLTLGEDATKLRELYGYRFQKDPHGARLQWKDETELDVDYSTSGRIDHMQLVASVD